jgi:hypothetical protein
MDLPSPTRLALVLALGLTANACASDRCPSFDFFAPPSAKVQLVDGQTGQVICTDTVTSNRGEAVFHPEVCEFWLPAWFPMADAGASLSLKAQGYFEQQVDFPVSVDDCGDFEAPPVQRVVLTPNLSDDES